jgi:thioesterase domain-containing protein
MRAAADRPVLQELAGGGGPLVAIAHPGVLPATVYQRLADELGDEHTVVVVDLTAIPEYWDITLADGKPDVSIEGIADRFNAELAGRAADAPAAPVVVGWSFGGVIGYAMVERGAAERPPELLLLDTMSPTEKFPEDLSLATPTLLSWFAKYLGAKRDAPLDLDQNRFAATSIDEGLAVIRDTLADRGAMLASTPVVGLRKLYDTFVDSLLRYTKLTNAYRPRPARHELTLVKPEGSLRPKSPDLGWSALAAEGLRVPGCPGDHYTMLADPAATAAVAGLVRDKTRVLLAGR